VASRSALDAAEDLLAERYARGEIDDEYRQRLTLLRLPPRLGAIMGELADRPPTRLMIHHGPDAPRWLFPGRVPGQPIDNHSLTNRLNRHGISARPARNGALMALAADLPAAIIADLLGMHINTAIRWVKYAGRDWADYLAAVR
jgi:hypothetical protein